MTESAVTPRPRRRWLRWAAELALFALLIAGIRAWQQATLAQGPAPELAGIRLDGAGFVLRPATEPTLIYFWATWCPSCRAMQGNIEPLLKNYRVITVAMQSEGDAAVGGYLKEHGLHYPVLNDPDGALARRYGVRAVPALFVVDREGMIRFTEVGYTTEPGIRARLWLSR